MKRPNCTTPPRVNFITPPKTRHRAGPNLTLITLSLILISLALGATAGWNHYELTLETTALREQDTREQQHVNHLTTALQPHHALAQQLDSTRERLITLRSQLPPQPDWQQHLTTVIERLPDIGSFQPAIILSTIEATAGSGSGAAAFGADPETTAPISLSITLNGHARERDAITRAVEAYERDPHLLTRFPGTSTAGEGRYDFRIDLAFLDTHPNLAAAR